MKNNFKSLLKKYLDSVSWFEIKKNKKDFYKQIKEQLIVIKSKKDTRIKFFRSYFNKYPSKLSRLSKNYNFLILSKKNKKNVILCSGWLYKGKRWKISEINKEVSLNNRILLFDFLTPKSLRNKGYYKKILILISKKFTNKQLAIYSLNRNKQSIKAIKNANFNFKKKIYGF